MYGYDFEILESSNILRVSERSEFKLMFHLAEEFLILKLIVVSTDTGYFSVQVVFPDW